jgi:hypothetical protein
LEGGDFERGKNFNLLCRAEFKTSGHEGRGGSYGLGKAVLWRFSEVATVLLSSRVLGSENKGIRMFGRADIPSHVIVGDGEYDSGGWFGERKKIDGSDCAESLWGDDRLAESLLLDRKYSGDTGTSSLIVGFFEPDEDESRPLGKIAQDIIESSERWYWPSMAGSTPALQVHVVAERNGEIIFDKLADPEVAWKPFIMARQAATTGAKAKSANQVAEASLNFPVPHRELPTDEKHPSFDAKLLLRVARGDKELVEHEKANYVAVFRGFEMVVKYVQVRKPLDDLPLFGVLMAGGAAGNSDDDKRADHFFRAAEPPLHNEWEYSEAVKNSYKKGSKQALQRLWASLSDETFKLIDESVTPTEDGPQLLAKMFPIGEAGEKKGVKHLVSTKIVDSSYANGKWKITGTISRAKPTSKNWYARVGFVAQTDSGPGEYLTIASLTTSKKSARLESLGPPGVINVDSSVDSFDFEAVLEPPASLDKSDLDLTAIRLSSGEVVS